MLGAFDLVQQGANVVVRLACRWRAQAQRLNSKRGKLLQCATLGQASAKVFVDDFLERAAGFTGLGLQFRGDVVVQGKRGSHA